VNKRLRGFVRSGGTLAEGGVAMARWPVFSLTSFRMVRDLIRQGVAPTLVIDVGANRGQFATAVLELVPKAAVLALEPLPAAADALRALVGRYPERLEVVEAAAGSEHTRATLTINAHSQSSSLRRLSPAHLAAFPAAQPVEEVEVAVVRLDQLLEGRPLGPGTMLKVDAQGFEREVLLGAGSRLREFEHVILEASFQPLYDGEWTFVEALQFARSQGLEFTRPVGSLRDPRTGQYLQLDALFSGTSDA
jgi:FkbM family methyltransferase